MRAVSKGGIQYLLQAVVSVFAVLLLQVPAFVSAHAFLVDTRPQAGERLGSSPNEVVLFFSEPIVSGSEELTVRDEAGEEVALLDLAPMNDGLWVRSELPPLADGVYRAAWQVMADDSHVSAGEFAFGVGEVISLADTGSSSSAGSVAWPEALGSLLLLVGMVLAVGGLVSERYVWRPVVRELGRELPRASLVASLLLALTGVSIQVVLLVAARRTSASSGYFEPLVRLEPLASHPDLLSIATLALLLYALWLGVWSSRMPRLRFLVLLPLAGSMITTAYRGHAASGAWWLGPVNALHLLLAGIWIGALLHLVQVLWTVRGEDMFPALARAAQRYAGLALVLVPPLLLAGAVTALAVVDRPLDLVATAYGRLLSAKLVVVAAVLALAVVARARALAPLIPKLLRRLAGFESSGLLVVVALSAVLANSAPPSPRGQALDALLGPTPLSGPVLRLADLPGQLALFLAAADGQLQLRLIEPSGEGADGAALEIKGRRPDGVTFDLYPRSCGPGCFSMDLTWPEGVTTITVAAEHDEWLGGEVEFELPWPVGKEASERLEAVIEEMKSIPSFTMTERVSSGPDATFSTGAFRISNPFFISGEVYANGGASDVRLLPRSEPGISELVLFLPGSFMWYKLWIDEQNRLVRELIVNPGHHIERTFTYDERKEAEKQETVARPN